VWPVAVVNTTFDMGSSPNRGSPLVRRISSSIALGIIPLKQVPTQVYLSCGWHLDTA